MSTSEPRTASRDSACSLHPRQRACASSDLTSHNSGRKPRGVARYDMPRLAPDLVVLHEHPEWQKPLFAALDRRGVSFVPFDVTAAAFSNFEPPRAPLYFNQASPSAYLRGHTRAVPLALAFMRSLERLGARVLNGADVFALELSKSAQATLLRTLGIECPHSITFNDVRALRAFAGDVRWPALLKPDQGGSGARIEVVESLAHVEAIFSDN